MIKTCRDCKAEFEPIKPTYAVCKSCSADIRKKISDSEGGVKRGFERYRSPEKRENTYETKYGCDR